MQVGNIINITDFTNEVPTNLDGTLAAASTVNGTNLVLNSIGVLGQLYAVGFKNCWESWRIECTVKLSAGTIFGLGHFGQQTQWPVSSYLRLNTTDNTFSYRYNNTSFSSRTLSIPIGTDIHIQFTHSRSKNTLVLKMNGCVYTITKNGISFVDTRVGYPAMFLHGGSAEISNFKFDLLEEEFPTNVYIGASTCKGGALTNDERAWSQLYPRRKNIAPNMYNIHAAGASNHADLYAHIVTMLQHQTPSSVYLYMGSNDDYNNTASWLPTRQSIVTTLTNAGITVVNLTISPDVNDGQYYLIRDALNANFTCVDMWTPLSIVGNDHFGNSIYYKPDGVHPNQIGHDLLQNQIP